MSLLVLLRWLIASLSLWLLLSRLQSKGPRDFVESSFFCDGINQINERFVPLFAWKSFCLVSFDALQYEMLIFLTSILHRTDTVPNSNLLPGKSTIVRQDPNLQRPQQHTSEEDAPKLDALFYRRYDSSKLTSFQDVPPALRWKPLSVHHQS
jgi:hypothetical protein